MIPSSSRPFATVLPGKDLGPRLAASQHRLQEADYDAAPVLEDGVTGAWPGDCPGRLVLALSRLASVTGEQPRQLQELVDGLPGRLNARGHLGPVHRAAVDEQQLAGHGWLVSGLLAHHRLTGQDRSRTLALDIVRGLFLPAASRLPHYPRRRPGDDTGGEASGSVVGREGGWLLSSDTYCVLIALEGLVTAYAASRDRELADAVEALAYLVDRDDPPASRAQLHATLTAARCLHDFHELTGSATALATARRLYDLYGAHGRTTHYATWNWFGRPDSWTEPCAVTDSVILALGLWRTTREWRYLEDVHAIEHNGLGHAQKPNGGFGLDSVTGPGQPWLTNVHPDAAWCCTMRGPVGLAELHERGYSLVRGGAGARARLGDGTEGPGVVDVLSVDLYHDGDTRLTLPGGSLTLRQRTTWPVGGRTELEVLESTLTGPLCVSFFLPSWSDPRRTTTTVNGSPVKGDSAPGRLVKVPFVGDRYVVEFPVRTRVRPETGQTAQAGLTGQTGPGHSPLSLWHGALLLGAEPLDAGAAPGTEAGPVLPADIEPVDPARAHYRAGGGPVGLSPVGEVFTRPGAAASGYRARVVFDPR